LTGITQNKVDKGIRLDEALIKQRDWLIKHSLLDKKTYKKIGKWTFLTCGDWDLFTCLPENCTHFKYDIPSYYNHWINLVNFYENFYNKKVKGMVNMLEILKIQLIGHHHSGIDDCQNIVQIVKKMTSEGFKFKNLPIHTYPIDARFIRDDDWICIHCSTHNFSKSDPCRICKKIMDEKSIIKQQVLQKPGDWICTACSVLNFSYRLQCFACKQERSDVLSQTYADWKCHDCAYINFSYRTQCHKCFAAKQT